MKNWKQKLLFKVYYSPFMNNAFTLAEVLITLGIIGVVAGMTIPILMNNIQDAQFKTAYKKAYSVACQAWQKAYTDNLLVPRAMSSDAANQTNFDAFKSEFDVVKDCSGGDPYDCWSSDGNKWYGAYPDPSAHAFIDKSGMAWTQAIYNHERFMVDTNGSKKPNQWGKDRFPLTNFVNGSEANKGIPDSIHIYYQDRSPNGTNGDCPETQTCYYQSWIIGAK